MTKRRLVLSGREGKWTAIPGLFLLAAGAVVLSAYSGASSSQHNSPVQPINFPHTVHAEARDELSLATTPPTSRWTRLPAVSTLSAATT